MGARRHNFKSLRHRQHKACLLGTPAAGPGGSCRAARGQLPGRGAQVRPPGAPPGPPAGCWQHDCHRRRPGGRRAGGWAGARPEGAPHQGTAGHVRPGELPQAAVDPEVVPPGSVDGRLQAAVAMTAVRVGCRGNDSHACRLKAAATMAAMRAGCRLLLRHQRCVQVADC
jgi:hypothetical protein